MKSIMKTLSRFVSAGLKLAGPAILLSLAVQGAAAQDKWPDGPIQIIVSYGAGGGTDTLARLLAEPLAKKLGQPVTVQNLPGAGGQVAASALLREPPNGMTILATNQPDLLMGVALNKAPYKAEDFRVIMADLFDPRIMLVKSESKFASFGDFVDAAKAEPGKLAVSVSQGAAQELFAKWLFGALGLDVRLVGYNGGSAAANAMIAGDTVATIGDDFARFNLREQTKALVVGGAAKSPRWPEAATLTEALKPYGVTPPSPDFLARYGVYVVPSAFKAENPAAYAKLQAAMIAARESASFKDYITSNKLDDLSIGKPGEDFDAAFAKSIEGAKMAREK